MLTRVPTITGVLRKHVLELAADPTEFVNRAFALLTEQEETYEKLPAVVARDVLGFLEYCAKLWLNTLTNGSLPSAAEMAALAEVARRRVHQGVPLTSILRAFRLGGLEMWKACIAVPEGGSQARDELLFSVSSFMLEFFDSMSQTMSQAYLDEQYQSARWRDSLRYELASIIFQFPDDIEGFTKAAEALGIDPTVPRVALALQLNHLAGENPAKLQGEGDRLALAAARKLQIAHDGVLRVFHRGRLIIWVPVIRGESLIAADRRLADGARRLLKAVPEIGAIGVGMMNLAPRGWAISVEEACKALEFGSRVTPSGAIHLYTDIALNEGVRRTDNVLRYANSLLERLADEPDLLSTLQSYFRHCQHRRLAADELGIHPNTLNHRLARIESLLGADLEDAGWIARLYILLQLRQ